MENWKKVILFGGAEADTGALLELLAKNATTICVPDLPELLRELASDDYDALFCDWSVDTGSRTTNWREVLKEVHQRYPEMPVIVVYHGANERDWADVLQAGAFDLMAPPYNEHEVLRVLKDAALSREAKFVASAQCYRRGCRVRTSARSSSFLEAADAVILEASLRKVDELIHIGRRMRSIALQSAGGGMALSMAGMLLAAAGYLPPVEGAIAQEIIDLAAVLNALRVALPPGELADF